MSRELIILCQPILVLFLTLFYNSHGYFVSQGSVGIGFNGYFTLTNTTKHTFGQAFENEHVEIKNSSTGVISSFSVNFFFAIVPEHNQQGSHGMAFVISPTRGLPGASSDQYLGIFNKTNNGKASNNVIAIELDIHKDEEFGDIDDNHVGININGLRSVASASAGYYDDKHGSFKKLSLISREVMRLSIVYSQPDQQLNVTLFPAEIPVPPLKPLLSLNRDLSPYLLEKMYLGFTASTGSVGAIHYLMGWFVNGVIEYPRLELSIPVLPPYPKKTSNRTKTVLAVCLTVSVFAAFVASWIGFVFYLRHKKVKEVLEEWEIQYGPHRFAYKELFNATKGFKEKQLLGKGGFGQVYKGTLPGSDAEIAVKRTSHDSRQGMSEFLAEISTIGRLRHPNLVRLLGYCRHKENLYLVYDYMPNGSLDKYLNRSENQERLTWEQRFRIIKDVATALLHLHQEWVQVIIHRDIKPANVLIDNEMNARLGDFGLAKLYDQGFDPETSKVAGTFGYIAPEFLRTGRATTSTDVYAFGLVMLEVVCGRRIIERRAAENEEYLVDWILELWENGKIFDAAEESIRQEQNRGQVELVLKLGVLCSHQAASIRPAMSVVMRILNGVSQLPDNLLDVVRAEKFREWPETSMELLLLDVNTSSSLELTDSSFVSHGR
ncbi:putative L-type lectin-domain containing receptor kinase V.5 RLK-Pelle-L-LEC family [Arabidopsis thaliana]|uniref:non-specific serine/threonine protein kinase n=2 Tax=Arabidopsis TaxID=3701 RepID=A0A178VHH1_ARATH|nr:Protein kinase-like domain superfamily [Arabidopsis thaliana x Arabidopsis arenosa]OAP05204.1 LECRK1 [Arabidopsis thaliana]